MRTKEKLSVGTIAFLAVYVLSWSIISLSYPDVFEVSHARFFNSISAIASLSVLVLSLMDFAFARGVKAEKLNQSALSISRLMRELERQLASSEPDVVAIRKIADEYERRISETQISHTPRDLRRWTYMNAKANNRTMQAVLWVRKYAFGVWFYASSMCVYIILVVAIVWATIWYTISVVVPGVPSYS